MLSNISRSARLIKIKGATRSDVGTKEKTEMEQEGEEDEKLLQKRATPDDHAETTREKLDPIR
ncbi:hypothetical protein ACLOJK_018267 [Asimina triloba]